MDLTLILKTFGIYKTCRDFIYNGYNGGYHKRY